jgi:limonene-1,2-epoxide hydrolase
MTTILHAAQRFAAALDAEDYRAAHSALAADCVYHAPEGLLVGPDRIVASYREHAESARGRFETIEYESAVEAIGPAEAVITFIDRVMLAGAWHQFRCQQRIRIDAAGLVAEIRHEELLGERERLQKFEAGGGAAGGK